MKCVEILASVNATLKSAALSFDRAGRPKSSTLWKRRGATLRASHEASTRLRDCLPVTRDDVISLMLLVALAIKFECPGPVLVKHTCIGRGGRRFQMLKFRTTVYDPDRALPIWPQRRRRLATSFDTPVSRTFRS